MQKCSGKALDLMGVLLEDQEIKRYHSYANVVSVRRLGFNDHGSVHARIVTLNAIKMLDLLHKAGVHPSIVDEEVAGYEDAQVAVVLGAFLHDIGMGVSRQDHEWHSVNLGDHIIRKYLADLYPENLETQAVLRALAHECITGHMGKVRIHSVEAGIVLAADGTDMAGGRSRIPQLLSGDPMVGDIHRYSAGAVKRVNIEPGINKAILISVQMDSDSGLFQVEEVLMTKLKASPILSHIELSVQIGEETSLSYLS